MAKTKKLKLELPKLWKSKASKSKKKPKKKNDFNIFAKFKIDLVKKKYKYKAPDFKVKTDIVPFLPDKPANIKYGLIEPFAYAEIKVKGNNVLYEVTEPVLTEKEKELFEKISDGLMEILDVDLSGIKLRQEAIDYIEERVGSVIQELQLKPKKDSFLKIMYFIYRDFVGLNEIEPLLEDPMIEDISCDGLKKSIFIVHRKYGSIKTNVMFNDEEKLKGFVLKLAERCGRFISYAEPLLDGSLPDGSRVQATFSKDVTVHGSTFTIRKFTEEPMTPIALIKSKTISSEMFAYLWLAIEAGTSILLAGGTGTGKTTLLNALSMFIPHTHKIISVEDTHELQLAHENWIPSVTRPGFAKGYGEVSMFDLLKASFRQRPDYIIVGEVRGKEAYVMFQGMASGMPALGTMHAGKVGDVVYRLQSPPISLPPALLETLDLILLLVHSKEKGESARRLDEIVEIQSVDPKSKAVITNRLFNWLPADDSFQKSESSWLLQEISKLKGVSTDELVKEIAIRKQVLDWMTKKGVKDYKEFTVLVTEYYKDKQTIMKKANVSLDKIEKKEVVKQPIAEQTEEKVEETLVEKKEEVKEESKEEKSETIKDAYSDVARNSQ